MLFFLSVSVQAQYTSQNSFMRKALVSYFMNSDGFYERDSDVMMNRVDDVEIVYAYDKKAHNLYLLTSNSNVVVTLNKDYAKIVRRNKSIPQLKDEELEKSIDYHTFLLGDKFSRLNRERELHLKDSIAKVIADSIEKVRRHKEMIAAKEAKKNAYRAQHDYHFVPTGGFSLYCDVCDNSFKEDSVLAFGISNDTIYYITRVEGALGLSYTEPHMACIPYLMASDERFKYHCEVFNDSLMKDPLYCKQLLAYMASGEYRDYFQALKKEAPYGYIDDWGWNDEYSMVTFHFSFVNTNPKTIKYITVYFKISNDVGDVRKTGYFKGTGPLAEGESASWNWDSSSYFVSGDASRMNITKVILTYMNGTKQVLTGKTLRFN